VLDNCGIAMKLLAGALCDVICFQAVNQQPMVIVTHQPYVSVPQVDPAAGMNACF